MSSAAERGRTWWIKGDGMACTPGSVPAAVTRLPVTIIHLGAPLPMPSRGLPDYWGEQPSYAACLALLRVGFTEPPQSPGALVVSYTTFSP